LVYGLREKDLNWKFWKFWKKEEKVEVIIRKHKKPMEWAILASETKIALCVYEESY